MYIPPSMVSTPGIACYLSSWAPSQALFRALFRALYRAPSQALFLALFRTPSQYRVWRLFGRRIRRLFERHLGAISSVSCMPFRALPERYSERSSGRWVSAGPSASRALFRALGGHLGVVSGAISALSWVSVLFRHQAPFWALPLTWAPK